MTGKEEYYVRCKNCGRLIKVFNTQTQAYCTNCEALYDYDTQDIVLSGITIVPSDYHYKWKEEKNLEDELTKYKRAFEILKDNLQFENLGEMQNGVMFRGYFEDCFSEEEYELLEELMKGK